MSQRPIDRSDDLRRLRAAGYDVEIRSGYLLVKDVPYVNPSKEVKRGTLVSELNLADDVTKAPGTHIVRFVGEFPCNRDGTPIEALRHGSGEEKLAEDLVVHHSFSNKPAGNYANYYDKMSRYSDIISAPAISIDSNVTPKNFRLVVPNDEDSVFLYTDTATSRANIGAAAKKLQRDRVAIIGLGGTGSYVLDLVAKTHVREIHLFDADKFSQHNAFRAPGAASAEDLAKYPSKVAYFRDMYAKMRRGIVPHEVFIGDANVDELRLMDFAFLCMDKGAPKQVIVNRLEEWGISFIDVGMGVDLVDDALRGVLRVTTSTKDRRDARTRIEFSDGDGDDAYAHNIQIADLNALNAALAVIKWKKLLTFYLDHVEEHHSTYSTDGNLLTCDHDNAPTT